MLIVIITSIILYYVVTGREINEIVLSVASPDVDLQVNRFHYIEVGKGDTEWVIDADTAQYNKNNNIAQFDAVTIKIIASRGQRYTIQGKSGLYNTETKNMELKGDVVIRSNKGDILTTDSLRYTDECGCLSTEDSVRFENENMELTGMGLVYDVNRAQFSITADVTAVVKRGMR